MSEIHIGLVKELRNRTQLSLNACREALVKSSGDIEVAIDILKKAGELKAADRAGRIATEGQILTLISADAKKAVIVEVNCQTDFTARLEEFSNFVTSVLMNKLHEDQIEARNIEFVRHDLISKTGENIVVRRSQVMEITEGNKIFNYIHNGNRIAVLLEMENSKSDEIGSCIAMQIAAMNPLAIESSQISAEALAKQKEIFMTQISEDPKLVNKPEQAINSILKGKMDKWFKEVSLLDQESVFIPGKSVKEILADSKVVKFIRYELGEGI